MATESRTEQIPLEYRVEFDDGVRPRLLVYGIDAAVGKLYGEDVTFAASVNVGRKVQTGSLSDAIESGVVQHSIEGVISISGVCTRFEMLLGDESEQHLVTSVREDGYNCIKVEKPEDINAAVDRHLERYKAQFEPLVEQLLKAYEAFVAEYPTLVRYDKGVKNG